MTRSASHSHVSLGNQQTLDIDIFEVPQLSNSRYQHLLKEMQNPTRKFSFPVERFGI